MFSSLRQRLHRQPAWIALTIVVFLCLWVASGTTAQVSEPKGEEAEAALSKVRVSRTNAREVNREVTLYGRTEPDRISTLRAEVQGKVVAIHAREGEAVQEGQKLLELDPNDLQQQLAAARSLLEQRRLEVEGAKSLDQRGYQSKTSLAAARAQMEQAVSQVAALELSLERTVIYAPFDGILNKRMVEVGDLLKNGDNIAEVVDLDPLIVVADITENYVSQLRVGQYGHGRLVSGEKLEGSIRYLSSVSAQGTNTFRMELAVPNNENALMAGMSTELILPLEKTWAMKITPAVLALDEEGNLGVKVVEDEIVRFVPIDIVKSDREGVWLAGMGEQADIITLGHGYVRDGDRVEVVYVDQDLQVSR